MFGVLNKGVKMKLLNNKIIALSALVLAFALPATSNAHRTGVNHDHGRQVRPDINRGQTQTIVLDRRDLQSLNQSGSIGLRRAVINKLGQSAVNQNTKLVSVQVTGRATGRMSQVALKIDGFTVDQVRLRQPRCNSRRHDCGGRVRSNSVTLFNNSGNSQGRWMLTSDIDTRINQLVVTIQKKRIVRERKFSLGTTKVTKLLGRKKIFRNTYSRLSSITVKANSSSLDIANVTVNYKDGGYKTLRTLSGHLRKNGTKTVKLNSRRAVESIAVDATSNDIFGSTGRLEVIVGVSNFRQGRRN